MIYCELEVGIKIMTFGSSLHPTSLFVFGAGWRIGVFSFQEKPELYSRNLAVVLHPFCVLGQQC